MIFSFRIHRIDGDSPPAHLASSLTDLRSWREYYVEAATEPTAELRAALADGITDPLVERLTFTSTSDDADPSDPADRSDHPAADAGRFEVHVAYQRGIVDNESDSIVAVCRLVGIDAVAAKVATTYASSDPQLATVIAAQACNPNIEELHLAAPVYDTLVPSGEFVAAEHHDLRDGTDDGLAAIGTGNGRQLSLAQMRRVREIQIASGAPTVTDVLLEALDARWSDHCAHTTWKSLGNLLGRLMDAARATANPNVVSMFHDNAGVWDFYDGYCIAVKAETHNGPSAVSAYFGQLTKIGGVLRDILGTGLGADPIGVFEYTATGEPGAPSPVAGRPDARQIARETIRAVKEYGNTFGVPMMSSHMTFHPAYRAKPFALGGSIGLIPRAAADQGHPEPGDLAVLIGGLTGNDGIHGASASSSGAVSMDNTAVQIGAPLEAIMFREAILDLRDAGCLRAITDLGAAGLNSAVGEMGDGVGVWLNTALVPLKSAGLPMWRILLSESQERMLLAVAPEQLDDTRRILALHEVRGTVVGRFTGDDRYCVVHDDTISEADVLAGGPGHRPVTAPAEVGFDLPYDGLDWRPDPRTVAPPPAPRAPIHEWSTLAGAELTALVERIVADPEVADQGFAAIQYDSSVQGRTHYGPLIASRAGGGVASGYYAARPLLDRRHGIVFSTGFDPWLFEADPTRAARQAVLAALTAQTLAGVALTDVCLCDNFYTPHLDPDGERWLVAMVDELAALSELLGTPFISGKDSSAGSTRTDEGVVSVPPAVFISALGKIPDVASLRPESWTTAGHLLVRLGPATPALAGTAAARALGLGTAEAGGVDLVDPVVARAALVAFAGLPLDLAPSGRRIGPGGIAATALFGALASGLGCELEAPDGRPVTLLEEHRIGALVEVDPARVADLPAALDPLVVGRIVDNGARVIIEGTDISPPATIDRWRDAFEEALR